VHYTAPCELNGLVCQVRDGSASRRPPLTVTFDDGYRDNLLVAAPMLDRAGVFATVFVTLSGGRGASEMWWDELARLASDPSAVQPEIGSEHLAPSDVRFLRIFDDLRTKSVLERERVLASLRANRIAETVPTYPLLEPHEIVKLDTTPAIEIGGHTMTHPVLSALPGDQQFEEVVGNRSSLTEVLGHPPLAFAYPFGTPLDYNRESIRAVSRSGYSLACANFTSRVGRRSPTLELPRMIVRDWEGEEFEQRLIDLLGSNV
jgi:peptidoglycan/xylan/chitin deacetylase (PgdA/CDA1 family)